MNIFEALGKVENALNEVNGVVNGVNYTANGSMYTVNNVVNTGHALGSAVNKILPNEQGLNVQQQGEYKENYNALVQSEKDIDQVVRNDVGNNQSLKDKLTQLESNIRNVVEHPTPYGVDNMAKELGVGTFSNRPGFHLEQYLNNIKANSVQNTIQNTQSLIQSLER